MGLKENVTYNIKKRKRTLQEHSGSSQRKEFEALSREVPKKNTKPKCRFFKKKKKKTPMLHLEARISLIEVMKQLRKLLQYFLLFKCSKPWNSVDGNHIAIA